MPQEIGSERIGSDLIRLERSWEHEVSSSQSQDLIDHTYSLSFKHIAAADGIIRKREYNEGNNCDEEPTDS